MREWTPEELGLDPGLCIPVPESKEEWKKNRLWPGGYSGASELKYLWGASSYGGMFTVWCEKMGIIDGDDALPQPVRDAADFGTNNEELLVKKGCRQLEGWEFGRFPYTVLHPEHSFMGCNYDSIGLHRSGAIANGECKVAKLRDIDRYRDAVFGAVNLSPPDNKIGGYWLQQQQAMGLLQAASIKQGRHVEGYWFTVADNQFKTFGPVSLNWQVFQRAISLVNELEYRLRYRTPPEAGPYDERTLSLLGHTDGAEWTGEVKAPFLAEDAEKLRELSRQKRDLEKEIETVRKKLAGATLGHASIDFGNGVGGKWVYTKPRFDQKSFVEAHPELAERFQTKPGYYWKVTKRKEAGDE